MLYICKMACKKIVIAVDGYAACGKSTLAKALAKKLNYIYVDSGAMYRTVTLYCLQNKVATDDAQAVEEVLPNIHITFQYDTDTDAAQTYLNGKNVERLIRSKQVSDTVSRVSVHKAVRHFLVQQQQAFGRNKGITMDGRDIGTVVFPDAELKIFVTANLAVRTQRRYEELQHKGIHMSEAEIAHNLQERDHIDSTRKESPLRQAKDAIVIDNSHLSRSEQLNLVLEMVADLVGSNCGVS